MKYNIILKVKINNAILRSLCHPWKNGSQPKLLNFKILRGCTIFVEGIDILPEICTTYFIDFNETYKTRYSPLIRVLNNMRYQNFGMSFCQHFVIDLILNFSEKYKQ